MNARSRPSLPAAGAAREARGVGAFIAVVLIVTALPYLFGYLTAPSGKQFMGILLNVPDTAQYFSWARESTRSVLIENKLTPEPGDAVFFNLFWLLVGRMSALLALGIPEVTQLVRLIAGSLYLAAIYWFTGLFAWRPAHRWAGFLVISLGGGLGWILVVMKQFTGELLFPLDLYVNEPNTFFTVMAFPHQAMATGLLILIMGLSAIALRDLSVRAAIAAGVLGLLLGLQHGYDLLVVYGVTSVTALALLRLGARGPRIVLLTAIICVPSAPVAVYLYWLTSKSPIWQGVLAQYGNAGVFTPAPAHLLMLVGIPLVLVLSARGDTPAKTLLYPPEILLRSWLVIGFLLLYIPTDFQIKMLAGWQVPVGVLATRAVFDHVAPALRGTLKLAPDRGEVAAGILLILVVLPVNIYLYAWRFVDLGRHDYPYYLLDDEVAALRWLESNAQPSDVVLSSLTIGQYVPSVSGSRAFLAHWAQTLDFYRKQDEVARFFDGRASEADRLGVVSRFGVQYVFQGEPERALGCYSPEKSPFLAPVFSSSTASVFRIVDTRLGARATNDRSND